MNSNVASLFEALSGVPRTQADINQIAQVSQQLQSPQVKQEIQNIGTDLKYGAAALFTLQAISTAAMVGMFLIALDNHRKGRK